MITTSHNHTKVRSVLAALAAGLVMTGAAGPLASAASATQNYGCGTSCQIATNKSFDTCDPGETNMENHDCVDAGSDPKAPSGPTDPRTGVPTAPVGSTPPNTSKS